MATCRLRMARQRGEAIARDHGFSSLPINPFEIAEAEGIVVQGKPPEMAGMSGCIVFVGDNVGIIYSTNIKSEGFRRFTVAHELGHYFLDGHPDEIAKTAGMHVSKAGFTQGSSSIELEADHFASGLLMPTHLTREVLLDAPVGLPGIEELAERAGASLTAAAIRAAECASYPIAIIVSKGASVAYCFMSDSFKRLGKLRFPKKGDPLPDTATRAFNAEPDASRSGKRRTGPSRLNVWFDCGETTPLDEEIVGLGTYGFTLTVLSSERLSEDPEEHEDEEELVKSWTPRFR